MTDSITEGKILKDLPTNLIFIKKAVQNFPNSQKVALYYCESLKKYFSITYDKNGLELCESDYSFIKDLYNILDEDDIKEIYFDNGLSLTINKECADLIIDLYEQLSEDKEEFETYIKESDQNFLNILDYSVRNKEKLHG